MGFLRNIANDVFIKTIAMTCVAQCGRIIYQNYRMARFHTSIYQYHRSH